MVQPHVTTCPHSRNYWPFSEAVSNAFHVLESWQTFLSRMLEKRRLQSRKMINNLSPNKNQYSREIYLLNNSEYSVVVSPQHRYPTSDHVLCNCFWRNTFLLDPKSIMSPRYYVLHVFLFSKMKFHLKQTRFRDVDANQANANRQQLAISKMEIQKCFHQQCKVQWVKCVAAECDEFDGE